MKCEQCGSKKAKRYCCVLKKNVCPQCCGNRKNKKKFCPPSCSYINPSPSPRALVSQITLTNEETGETFPLLGDIYLPSSYTAMKLFLTKIDISSDDSNTLKVTLTGQIKELYPDIIEQLYFKEEWKQKMINPILNAKNHRMSPIISIVENSGYVIYPEDIVLRNSTGNSINIDIDPEICFLILPESFPRMASRKMAEKDYFVLFFGDHSINIILSDPVYLKELFNLEFTIHNYSNNYSDGTFNWLLPLIFPFGKLQLSGITSTTDAKLALTDSSVMRTLSPYISKSIWGMENGTVYPFPEELRSRLMWGKEMGRFPISTIEQQKLDIDKIHCLAFDLKYRPVEELHISLKIGKYPISLALYEHLNNITALSLPLSTSFITNTTDTLMTLIVTAEIENITGIETKTLTIGSKQQMIFNHAPHLLPNKKLPPETCMASFKVTVSKIMANNTSLIFSQSVPVRVLAKDTMIWNAVLPNGVRQNIAQYIACWVTPHIKEIDEITSKAVMRHPQKAFTGYQQSTPESVRDQVKAIYDELSAMPLTYISRAISFGNSDSQAIQRVLTPRNTLKSHGNCIDLAVLMASILESININPVIVLIPGHAFLGWETSSGKKDYDFLECTRIGRASFEQACIEGQTKYIEIKNSNIYKPLQVVNINEMRKKKVFPMNLD
jgi:hypothetical protein